MDIRCQAEAYRDLLIREHYNWQDFWDLDQLLVIHSEYSIAEIEALEQSFSKTAGFLPEGSKALQNTHSLCFQYRFAGHLWKSLEACGHFDQNLWQDFLRLRQPQTRDEFSQFLNGSRSLVSLSYALSWQYAQAFIDLGQAAEALQVWQDFLKDNPQNFSALLPLARGHFLNQDYALAIESLEPLLKQSYSQKLSEQALYLKASSYQRLGDCQQARELFEELLVCLDAKHHPLFEGAQAHLNALSEKRQRDQKRFEEHYDSVSLGVWLSATKEPRYAFCVSGALGDVLMSEPCFQALREQYPGDWSYWTGQAYVQLARQFAADHVIAYSDKRYEQNIPYERLLNQNYQRVYCVQPSVHAQHYVQQQKHVIDFYAELCAVTLQRRRPHLPLPQNDRQQAEDFRTRNSLERYVVLAHANFSAGNWPLAKYLDFIRVLQSRGLKVLLVGGSTDLVLPADAYLMGQSLLLLKALLDQAVAFVGPDSGPAWLAASARCPMIVLMDSLRQKTLPIGFAQILQAEKDDIIELPLSSEPQELVECLELFLWKECV